MFQVHKISLAYLTLNIVGYMVVYEAQWGVWVWRKVASKKKTVKELKVGGSRGGSRGGSKWLEDGSKMVEDG